MKFRMSMMLASMGLFAFGLSAQEHLKSLDKNGLDNTISPRQDFYNHVNKKWMESHPLSPEYSRYGSFNILSDSSEHRVRRIVTGLAATNPAKGTDAYKIANLYELGMDSIRRNREGAAPIRKKLAKIENARPEEMTDLFRYMQRHESSPLFSMGFQEDLGNSKQYAMYVSGVGLGLGDRDYYLLNDKSNREIRKAYTTLIEKQMQLAVYSK